MTFISTEMFKEMVPAQDKNHINSKLIKLKRTLSRERNIIINRRFWIHGEIQVIEVTFILPPGN